MNLKVKMSAFNVKTLLGVGIPYVVFFFTPIAWSIVGIGVLLCADLFTGIRAAKARGEEIRSKPMGRTVGKMLYYGLAIIISRVMELAFIPWLPVAQLTAGYIAIVEFKSNMENIGELTGTDIWTRIKEVIESSLGRKQ